MIFTLVLLVVALPGCKWRDDFRDRRQPQYFEQEPKPTLNPDSVDYEGNDIDTVEQEEKAMKLPAIDGRSKIPEVPEYPAGVEVK